MSRYDLLVLISAGGVAYAGCNMVIGIDETTECESIDECQIGSRCQGDMLIECVMDGDGCMIERASDCSARGHICAKTATGAGALCQAPCSPSACVAPGKTCQGDVLRDCQVDAAGCLIAEQIDCALSAQVCADTGAEPACVAASSFSCSNPLIVSDSITLSGDDFLAKFPDSHSFTGPGCRAPDSPDAHELVVQIDLEPGQTLWVSERDWMDAKFLLLEQCDDTSECLAAPTHDLIGIRYTAEREETLFAVIIADNATAETNNAYEISIMFTECGDGITEGFEQCDDGNDMSGDGCLACEPEFGYYCEITGTSSVCQRYPSLGVLAPGDPIPSVSGGPYSSGHADYYNIEFTQNIYLTGAIALTAVSPGTSGDADIRFENEAGQWPLNLIGLGEESWSNEYLAAGKYVIELSIWGTGFHEYELTMSSIMGPVCGNGAVETPEECDDGNGGGGDGCTGCVIDFGWDCNLLTAPSACAPLPDLGVFATGDPVPPLSAGPLSAGDQHDYMITFSTSVLLSGTLTSTTGDADFYLVDDSRAQVVEQATTGAETISMQAVGPGTYQIQIKAFINGGDISQYTLQLGTN